MFRTICLWRDSLDHTFGRACLLERLAGQALDAGYFLPCSCWNLRVGRRVAEQVSICPMAGFPSPRTYDSVQRVVESIKKSCQMLAWHGLVQCLGQAAKMENEIQRDKCLNQGSLESQNLWSASLSLSHLLE